MTILDIINAHDTTLGSDPSVNTFITLAQLRVNYNVWGTKGDLAVALMACHMMTSARKKGQAGSVNMQKVGDLQVQYSSPKSDDALEQTSYGKEFVALRKTLAITPLNI